MILFDLSVTLVIYCTRSLSCLLFRILSPLDSLAIFMSTNSLQFNYSYRFFNFFSSSACSRAISFSWERLRISVYSSLGSSFTGLKLVRIPAIKFSQEPGPALAPSGVLNSSDGLTTFSISLMPLAKDYFLFKLGLPSFLVLALLARLWDTQDVRS